MGFIENSSELRPMSLDFLIIEAFGLTFIRTVTLL